MAMEYRNPICQHDRRAAFLVDRLDALRWQAMIARCQIAKAHDGAERELLARRLDLTDARSADIAARLHSIGAAP
jgi:hypothetical protein